MQQLNMYDTGIIITSVSRSQGPSVFNEVIFHEINYLQGFANKIDKMVRHVIGYKAGYPVKQMPAGVAFK